LRAGLERIDARFTGRWPSEADARFGVVCRTPTCGGEIRWLADLAARTITRDDADSGAAEWAILGSPEAWRAVLSGQVNLHVALRRCDLRYCSAGKDGPVSTQTRVAMLADLLGLSAWQPADAGDAGDAIQVPVTVRS
jgi:hypothetical protein